MPGIGLLRFIVLGMGMWGATGCGPNTCPRADGGQDAAVDADICNLGDTLESYNGRTGTAGVGLCQARIETCVETEEGNQYQVTQVEVTPAPEIMGNGLDENCDGYDDVCGLGDMRAYYSGAEGTQDVGQCRAGIEVCEVTESGIRYQIMRPDIVPTAEIVDNVIDEDCNGFDDECNMGDRRVTYSGPEGTANVGACRDQVEECRATEEGRQFVVVEEEVLPSDEVCDGLDNDCWGPSPGQLWSRYYGDGNDSSFRALGRGSDGGFIAAGHISMDETGYGWLLRVDEAGNILWQHTYNSGNTAYLFAVEQTSDGGFIAAGNASFPTAPGGFDAWLLRTDAAGTAIWSRTYSGHWPDYFYGVQPTTDGGFLAVGAGGSSEDGAAWLVKVDAEGIEEWERSLWPGSIELRSIQPATPDGFILAGTINAMYGFAGWLLRINEAGDELWNYVYHAQHFDSFFAVIQESDGGFVAAGVTSSYFDRLDDGWLLRVDMEGTERWHSIVETRGSNNFASVVGGESDGYIAAGTFDDFSAGWLTGIDGAGVLQWHGAIDDVPGENAFYAMQPASDGNYVVAGEAHPDLAIGMTQGWLTSICIE